MSPVKLGFLGDFLIRGSKSAIPCLCQAGVALPGRILRSLPKRRPAWPAQISDFNYFVIFVVFLKFWGRSSKSVRKKYQILKANVSPAKLGFFSDFLTRGSKAAIPCPCPAGVVLPGCISKPVKKIKFNDFVIFLSF